MARSPMAALVVLVLVLLSPSGAAAPALLQPIPVVFASNTPGLQLSGLLYRPASSPAPAILILSGTSGREGFQNWETPWAQRLQQGGYVALIVDSFTPRHLAFAEHWRLSPQARGQDAGEALYCPPSSSGSEKLGACHRQGSCARPYPEVAYHLGNVVNGTGSGLVANVRLSNLMNGHFAIAVLPSGDSSALSSCGDIPRNT